MSQVLSSRSALWGRLLCHLSVHLGHIKVVLHVAGQILMQLFLQVGQRRIEARLDKLWTAGAVFQVC